MAKRVLNFFSEATLDAYAFIGSLKLNGEAAKMAKFATLVIVFFTVHMLILVYNFYVFFSVYIHLACSI